MKTTIEYLDEAKKALGIDTDYALAKYLGTSRMAVSRYYSGQRIIDDYAAAKIAAALNIDTMYVIAAANAEREKTADRKEYWQNFYERLGGVAASLFLAANIGLVTFKVTTSPAEAFKDTLVNFAHCILCNITMTASF